MTIVRKLALTLLVLVTVTCFFPIVLFVAVLDAVRLCVMIAHDCLHNLWDADAWNGEYK